MKCFSSAIAMIMILCATPVFGQIFSPDDALIARKRTANDEAVTGIRAGGFLIYPGIQLNMSYDDNIFRTEDNIVSDFVTDVRPGIGIQSNWNRHAIFLGAEGDFGMYRDNSRLNYNDYGLLASGQYDLTYGTFILASLSREKRHAGLGVSADPNGGRPIAYTANAEEIQFTRDLSMIKLDLTARNENVTLSDITDPALVSLSNFNERDNQTLEAMLRYEPVPDNNVFTRITYDTSDYRLVSGSEQSSQGFDIRAGGNIGNIGPLGGSLYAGYLFRNYDTGAANTQDPYFGGTLNWDVTPLTTASVTLDKKFNQTTVAGAAGVVHTTRKATLRQGFTTRISGDLTFGVDDNDYVGGGAQDRETRLHYGTVAGTYKISGRFGLRLGYSHDRRSSSLPGDEYRDNRAVLSLTFMQ